MGEGVATFLHAKPSPSLLSSHTKLSFLKRESLKQLPIWTPSYTLYSSIYFYIFFHWALEELCEHSDIKATNNDGKRGEESMNIIKGCMKMAI